MECKYCTYKGSIFSLRQHIMNKLICKNKYTKDDLLEFEKIYESHKKEKRKIARANYHKRNKHSHEFISINPSNSESFLDLISSVIPTVTQLFSFISV